MFNFAFRIPNEMKYNEKQLQIINTAESLFASKGYDGTSVRDIADEAGINIAMISYYFGSKEKLMQALIEERTDQVRLRVERLLNDNSLLPFEKISVLIDEYVARVVQKRQFYKIMVCEQMLEKNHVITDLLNGLKRQTSEMINQIIKDGQKKKVFKKGIDVVLLTNTMVGTVMQTFINQEYYKFYNNLNHLSEVEFQSYLQKKLSTHIKSLFKAILSYES